MKKLLVAALVGMCSAAAPLPAARADGPGWVGSCSISTVNDTTPDETLGGWNVWNGQVNIAVVATTPGDTIRNARCTIMVNGGGESTILTATAAGPVAVGAGRATFTAAESDTVKICTYVNGRGDGCRPLTTTPICPERVCGEGGLLDQGMPLVDEVNEVAKIFDPALCGVLRSLAPTANALPTLGVLYIDPTTGDTFVGGTTPEDLFWDCSPYDWTPNHLDHPHPVLRAQAGDIPPTDLP